MQYLPLVYLVKNCACMQIGVIVLNFLRDPGDKVILESAFDELMEQVW